jgi:2-iminobutanoate/2-iminopropanoate deaminase
LITLKQVLAKTFTLKRIGEIMISHIQPKTIPESEGCYSQIVVDDRYVFLSGLVAADFPEGQKVLGDVKKETRAILTAIRSMLAEMGLDTNRIVRTDVHLANLDDFEQMDGVYREFFEGGRYPARTTTESPKLYEGSRVEITCMARRS